MEIAIDTETYEEKEGKLNPILNAREIKLGAILTDRRKEPFFFYNNKDMLDKLLEIIEKANNHNEICYIRGHNIAYDFYGLFKDKLA